MTSRKFSAYSHLPDRKVLLLVLCVAVITCPLQANDLQQHALPEFPHPQLVFERVFTDIPPSIKAPAEIYDKAWAVVGKEGLTLGSEFLYNLENILEDLSFVDIYNGLTAFSIMSGISYDSPVDNTTKVVIRESFRIAGPGLKEPVPDPYTLAPEKVARFYLYQDMLDFGEVIWQVDITYTGSEILVDMHNCSAMYYGIFRIVEPGDFTVLTSAVQQDSSVAVYQAGSVVSGSMDLLRAIGFGKYLEKAFFLRMKALKGVF